MHKDVILRTKLSSSGIYASKLPEIRGYVFYLNNLITGGVF